MFKKGVRPLAEKEPLATAVVLAKALDEMVQLRMEERTEEEHGDEDVSEVWCRRLDRISRSFEEPSNVLVECLTFASGKGFRASSKSGGRVGQIFPDQAVENFQAISGTSLSTLPWGRDQALDSGANIE